MIDIKEKEKDIKFWISKDGDIKPIESPITFYERGFLDGFNEALKLYEKWTDEGYRRGYDNGYFEAAGYGREEKEDGSTKDLL